MTEIEVAEITAANAEAFAAFWGNFVTHMGIYLSLLFGYCAAAYVAGRELSRFQVLIASALFVGAAELQIYAMSSWVSGAKSILIFISEINPELETGVIPAWARGFGMILWQLAIIACLSFMWSIRRQKTQ